MNGAADSEFAVAGHPHGIATVDTEKTGVFGVAWSDFDEGRIADDD